MNFNFQNTNSNVHNRSAINQPWFIIGMVAIALILIGTGISFTNNSQNNDIENNNKLFSFSGIYTNGNKEITIYVGSDDYIMFNAIADQTFSSGYLELDGNNNLFYEDESFGETSTVKIEKTTDGINVTASSSDVESLYNNISGSYTKKLFTAKGWSGIYTYNDIRIVIDEYYEDRAYITISRDFSTYGANTDQITDTILTSESDSFGENDTLRIEKTIDGISVTASSSDSDSLLNEISGTYKKR